MMNIDNCKRYVLARNGLYLTQDPLRITNSAYIAEQYRAKIRVFNPVTGEIACG